MRGEKYLTTIVLCLTIVSTGVVGTPCEHYTNDAVCKKVELNINEPIHFEPQDGPAVKELTFYSANGSIGVKTLSSFPELETLVIEESEINEIEEGALCSSAKLKSLSLKNFKFPLLTKRHFRGCKNLETLICEEPLEEDALEGLSGLKTLYLAKQPSLSKTYFAHLEHLNLLFVKGENLDKVEPGVFCTSSLENLRLSPKSPLEITDSLFHGCDNLREFYLENEYGTFPEKENTFGNLTSLENITLTNTGIAHLTRNFFSGIPNLKKLLISGKQKLTIASDSFTGVAPHLIRLRLRDVRLEDADIKALPALAELKVLDLNHNKLKDLDVLGNQPKLRALYVASNEIAKFDLSAFKKKFPDLILIDLSHNPLSPDFMKELEEETGIEFRYELGHINKVAPKIPFLLDTILNYE